MKKYRVVKQDSSWMILTPVFGLATLFGTLLGNDTASYKLQKRKNLFFWETIGYYKNELNAIKRMQKLH